MSGAIPLLLLYVFMALTEKRYIKCNGIQCFTEKIYSGDQIENEMGWARGSRRDRTVAYTVLVRRPIHKWENY
jgi:hypothetical protein